jgi:hypothetical protein
MIRRFPSAQSIAACAAAKNGITLWVHAVMAHESSHQALSCTTKFRAENVKNQVAREK